MTAQELKALANEISAKNAVIAEIYKKAAVEGELNVYDLKGAELDDVKAKMAEVDKLTHTYEVANLKAQVDGREAWLSERKPFGGFPAGGDGASAQPFKTWGEQITDSDTWKGGNLENKTHAWNLSGTASLRQLTMNRQVDALKAMGYSDLDALKTAMTTGAGFAPANDRTDLVVGAPSLAPTLADRIPSRDTDLSTIYWMLQTTRTNGAASASENSALAESTIVYTEQSSPVQLVGGKLPVSEQQLADVQMVQSIVNDDLLLMYRQKEEDLLMNGDGVAPNIYGYLALAINSQARGTDPIFDAVHKGMTTIETSGRAMADLLVMHPNDYQRVRLTRTTEGIYIYGSPVEAGPERMWGVPILKTTSIAEGTTLAGAFQAYSQIWRRQGVAVELGYDTGDWGYLRRTFRFYGRMVMICKRLTAFTQVTGLAA